MRTALFSDIHANWEALETAAGHAAAEGVNRYIVLGDTLGYGANPNECFSWVIENADINLLGNHEKAVVDPLLRDWFNEFAREAIIWTEEVLQEDLKEKIRELPYLKIESSQTFVHGSLDEPEEFHYVTSLASAIPTFRQMENAVCFIGHTHVPSCFCEARGTAGHLEPGVLPLEAGIAYILNPGSVGQPRDGDPRLSYGIYDDQQNSFELIRLPYDHRKAAGKIYKAGLPRFLGDRLLP